jgi:hypothetical protein
MFTVLIIIVPIIYIFQVFTDNPWTPLKYGGVDLHMESKRTSKYTGFNCVINIKFIFLLFYLI